MNTTTCNSILVTSGTGNVGKMVVRYLEKKDSNACIKVCGRNESKFKQMGLGKNCSFFKLDYMDNSTWNEALKNVDRVFLVALPLDPNPEKTLGPFIEKCKEMKTIKKIVFLSVLNAERFPLMKIESLLKSSGLTYGILRPPFFNENISEGFMKDDIKKGLINVPAGNHAVSWISTHDIGECASVMLLESKFDNQMIEITGPSALTYEQVSDILSKQMGRTIKFNDVKPDEFNKSCLSSGLPKGSTEYLMELYSAIRDDKTNRVTKGVSQITGHEPIAFEKFASECFSKTSMPGM